MRHHSWLGLAGRAKLRGKAVEDPLHRAGDLPPGSEDNHLQVLELDSELRRGVAVADTFDLDQPQRLLLAQ